VNELAAGCMIWVGRRHGLVGGWTEDSGGCSKEEGMAGQRNGKMSG
jgi:hypothetical protein